jgi:hypothetical protein
MGSTGSGKSTLTHYLAGSKMIKKIINGNPHIEPVIIDNINADLSLKDVKSSY